MVDSLTRSTFKGDSIITFYIVGVLSIMADCCRYELCEVGGFILSICTSHFFMNSQSTAAGCTVGKEERIIAINLESDYSMTFNVSTVPNFCTHAKQIPWKGGTMRTSDASGSGVAQTRRNPTTQNGKSTSATHQKKAWLTVC
jgi:hypothetical protein